MCLPPPQVTHGQWQARAAAAAAAAEGAHSEALRLAHATAAVEWEARLAAQLWDTKRALRVRTRYTSLLLLLADLFTCREQKDDLGAQGAQRGSSGRCVGSASLPQGALCGARSASGMI
jgi:hypothetical protein